MEYIPITKARTWEKNPKLHDIGSIIESIKRYGFKDPPKYEPFLNGGEGGIVEGNGRIEALETMRRLGEKPPAGIKFDNNDWYVPIVFGVDAKNEMEAEAYGIDHNNIVMLGGNFLPLDIAGIWDEKAYLDVIKGIEITPVSVDWESLNVLDEFIDKKDNTSGKKDEITCPYCGEKFKR